MTFKEWKADRQNRYPGTTPTLLGYWKWVYRNTGERLEAYKEYLAIKKLARRNRDQYAGLTDTAAYWYDVKRRSNGSR